MDANEPVVVHTTHNLSEAEVLTTDCIPESIEGSNVGHRRNFCSAH